MLKIGCECMEGVLLTFEYSEFLASVNMVMNGSRDWL